MKRTIITLLLSLFIATISITACGNKTTSDPNTEDFNTEINTEVNAEINTEINTEISAEINTEINIETDDGLWIQLSSLKTHPEIRQEYDKYFNVTGSAGNKAGAIYYNADTHQNDQNTTFYMTLKNSEVCQVRIKMDRLQL